MLAKLMKCLLNNCKCSTIDNMAMTDCVKKEKPIMKVRPNNLLRRVSASSNASAHESLTVLADFIRMVEVLNPK